MRKFSGKKSPQKIFNIKLRKQWLERKEYTQKCSDGGKNSGKSRRNKAKTNEGASKDLQTTFIGTFKGPYEGPMNSSSSSSIKKKKEFNLKSKSEARKMGDQEENNPSGTSVLSDAQASAFLNRLMSRLKTGYRKDGFETIGQAFGSGGGAA